MQDYSCLNLRGRSFAGQDLRHADFSCSNLYEANFTGAELGGANFSSASLIKANFTNANLKGANFTSASTSLAKFTDIQAAPAGLTAASDELLQQVEPWRTILNFRPSQAVQRKVIDKGREWSVHKIEDGTGDLSLDIYSVRIELMPKLNGQRASAADLVTFVRLNLNELINTSVSTFEPFDDTEAALWSSEQYTGAIVLIDMLPSPIPLAADSGCVVSTRRTENEWIFSTIRAGDVGPIDSSGRPAASHPVSGNRAFGVYKTTRSTYVFYNVAADRPSRYVDRFNPLLAYYQKSLWTSLQTKLVKAINDRGGQASVGESKARSVSWDWAVESKLFSPTDPWVHS